MAAFYIACSLVIIAIHIEDVPRIFVLIIEEAFTPTAAQGGFLGATVWMAIRYGVARGVFSNEAGLGSAAIAHATATTENPVAMGFIGMLGTFIDTIIVCSMTAFSILVTGVWTAPDANGAALTSVAFNAVLPGAGSFLVTISLAFFAFSTILGWCVYGERCWVYLPGRPGSSNLSALFTIVAILLALSPSLIPCGRSPTPSMRSWPFPTCRTAASDSGCSQTGEGRRKEAGRRTAE